jgi:hypothetical protein
MISYFGSLQCVVIEGVQTHPANIFIWESFFMLRAV